VNAAMPSTETGYPAMQALLLAALAAGKQVGFWFGG